jgi:hypothetical protein
MAKAYQIFFDVDFESRLETIAYEQRTTGRQFIMKATQDAIKKIEEQKQVFKQTEFIFKMKDGSIKPAFGRNAGTAWQSLGFSPEKAQEMMVAYLTREEAQAAGWFSGQKQQENVQDQDLPFGK